MQAGIPVNQGNTLKGMGQISWREGAGSRRARVLALALGAAMLALPGLVLAVECAQLDTPAKIREFIRGGQEVTPLWQGRVSAHLEVSPCEGAVCDTSQRDKRISLIKRVHFMRDGANRRAFVKSGPLAPQCIISRGERDSLCARCDDTTNRNCSSVVREQTSTRVLDTNIDLGDWDLLTAEDYRVTCRQHPEKADLLIIRSETSDAKRTYQEIETNFDKVREVPLRVAMFSSGVLRKVYRFFPKYIVQVDGRWVATIMRVRTTQGSEKDYVFETQISILPGPDQKPMIYHDPTKDPLLKGYNLNQLFFTN